MMATLRRLKWFAPGALLAFPAVALILAAAAKTSLQANLKQPGWAWSLAFALAECTIVAVAAPFWAAGCRRIREAFARLVLFQAGSGIVLLCSAALFGGGPLGAACRAQGVVFCFGALLIAITSLGRPERRWRMQAAAALIGLAMLGTTFYANPPVEMMPTSASRAKLIDGLLYANPVVVITGSIYNYDYLRGGPRRLYDYCVIGPYYPHRYPSWTAASLIYLIAAVALSIPAYRRDRALFREEADDA